MTLNVLISCMNEIDTSIIERSNIQTDCVVVNQCNHNSIEEFDFINKKGSSCHCKFINTTERGLSRSRNMAIRYAWGDICQICDDDEVMDDDGVEKILKVYKDNPDVDIATFQILLDNSQLFKEYPKSTCKVGFKRILQTSSVEITFRLNKINTKHIRFDERMGSGTGNGAGEENKFLFDCRRNKLNISFFPEVIALLNNSESKWFNGYDELYFKNHGWAARRSIGGILSFIYIFVFILKHHVLFNNKISFFKALKWEFKGYFSTKD